MTQIKLWQIVSQTPNAIVFSDGSGNLKSLPTGKANQVLVIGADGMPIWADNNALIAALEAKNDALDALATAKAFTEAQIAALVDNAPIALNTLNELALKLNGEDSAINALLLQVDNKAEKTELATQIAQVRQDAVATAKDYTDTAVGTALGSVPTQIAQAKSEAITTAAGDATFKSESAKTAAIAASADFTTQAVAQGLDVAASDATSKVNAGLVVAAHDASAYTDAAITALRQTASADAAQKASDAKSEAISEANSYTDSGLSALTNRLFVTTTATACFVRSSNGVDPQGGITLASFAEVTGADINGSTVIKPKMLFVNGLAMANDWTAPSELFYDVRVSFGPRLQAHAFDGTDNAIMVLCEYTTTSSVYEA